MCAIIILKVTKTQSFLPSLRNTVLEIVFFGNPSQIPHPSPPNPPRRLFRVNNIEVKNVMDNKNFWKTMRQKFSSRCKTVNAIILVEHEKILKDNKVV